MAADTFAAWIEGFLKGSGELLAHDEALFGILDGWLSGLPAETFPQLLPLLRILEWITSAARHGEFRRKPEPVPSAPPARFR